MKRLLDNYIFSDTLRYEGHRLIYAPESREPIVLGGILGAAVLCARLLNTDEQRCVSTIRANRCNYRR